MLARPASYNKSKQYIKKNRLRTNLDPFRDALGFLFTALSGIDFDNLLCNNFKVKIWLNYFWTRFVIVPYSSQK